MFVDLIESLRCPRTHDESALVVAAGRVVDRHIIDGTLGCPVCGAEFKIVDGITHFAIPPRATPPAKSDIAMGLRIAAFLELTDTKGFAILCGAWGAQVEPIQRVSDTPLLLVNPPVHFDGEPAGVIVCDEVLPLTPGSARAAALDDNMPAAHVASAVGAVRSGGRLIGPVSTPLPADVTEVARDESLWVAERAASVLYSLRRG